MFGTKGEGIEGVETTLKSISALRFFGSKELANNSFPVSFYSVYPYKHPSDYEYEKHQLSKIFLSPLPKF